jgi:methionyl-tRNA formyltransferase
MDLRVVFMGTPDFAVPTLYKLTDHFDVIGVVTQPDRPAGRKRELLAPPVKTTAEELGLDLIQPDDINAELAYQRIVAWNPDLICVAAFGQILKPRLLELPEHGCLNVHASLLPRWRGASPINAAILAGDTHSGVTIMKMGPGLDDGPILAQESIEIGKDQTAGSLSNQLSELGADLLIRTIPSYITGQISLQDQDHSRASMAKMLQKRSGQLDFETDAEHLARMVRAFAPWPGTFTFWDEKRVIIHQARSETVTSPGPGVLTRYDGFPAIGTGQGILVLEQLQLAGKKILTGPEFLNGNPDWPQDH